MAKKSTIVMGVCVDKARGQVLALSVNLLLAGPGATNFCNPSIFNADVTGEGLSAKPIKKCPECKKLKLRRLIGTGAGIIFKGSGFYETDYRSDGYKKAAKSESDAASATKTETKTAAKSAEKSESKSEPKADNKPAAKSESKKSTSPAA